MRRDMDLIRLLLLNLEGAKEQNLSDYSKEQIEYHNYLIIDGGLALGTDVTGLGDQHKQAYLTDLTWAGHDFIDAARDDTNWKKVISKVRETTGSVAFDVLKSLLIAYSKEKLGL